MNAVELSPPPRPINRGAWFGSQIGGTAYLLTGTAALVGLSPRLVLLWAGCFVAASAVGVWLYRRSGRYHPLAAFALLASICVAAGVVAVGTTYLMRPEVWAAMR